MSHLASSTKLLLHNAVALGHFVTESTAFRRQTAAIDASQLPTFDCIRGAMPTQIRFQSSRNNHATTQSSLAALSIYIHRLRFAFTVSECRQELLTRLDFVSNRQLSKHTQRLCSMVDKGRVTGRGALRRISTYFFCKCVRSSGP